ncbi:hypothetical protein C4D60_Mb06t00780 [Musa balbisiana]|uniref:Uncharacterized protein n=1 Tax=Musa balbisiana TaxID=52838 RepID=A0A4S8IJL9_MUSBA|nr:hypothetical protein C4D60_Mb06t00780 [Musa balbisiana]
MLSDNADCCALGRWPRSTMPRTMRWSGARSIGQWCCWPAVGVKVSATVFGFYGWQHFQAL